VPRPIDHQRRAALLDAAVDYAVEHGFAELSWRPVAQALGVSVTTLVHHFGTKERMLEAILGRVRDRILAATAELAGAQPDLPGAARAIWAWSSSPRHRAMFGLFFAVYGRALQQPELFRSFLDHVVSDWMAVLDGCLPPGTAPGDGRTARTLVIAVLRGLILDLLTTGDEQRVGQALEAFLGTLDEDGAASPAGPSR
jgi:AcrR family transcriptional regulator